MKSINKKLLKILKSKGYKESLGIESFKTRLASIIFDERKKLGLTQDALAKKANTTKRIISNIENERYNMGSDLIFRIWKALNKQLITDNKDLITGQKIQSFLMFFVERSKDMQENHDFEAGNITHETNYYRNNHLINPTTEFKSFQ